MSEKAILAMERARKRKADMGQHVDLLGAQNARIPKTN